jgi:DNA-binding MarR family transcriptional regulator
MMNPKASTARLESDVDLDVLSWLLVMPFLDPQELASLAEWPSPTIYRAVRRLEYKGLVASVQVSAPLIASVRRLYLSMPGIEALAETRMVPAETLLQRYPVSAHWLRLLVTRLDGITSVYRMAAMLADVASVKGFRWYRKMPLDAAFELDGGRMFAVLREGSSAPPSHLARRLRSLLHGRHLDTVLVIAPDSVRLRDWRRLLGRLPFKAAMELEKNLLTSDVETPAWYVPSDPNPWPLTRVIHMARGGAIPVEKMPSRLLPPPRNIDNAAQRLRGARAIGRSEDSLLPLALKAGEKRILDLLALWPWASSADMANLLAVSRERVLQMLEVPLNLKLAIRVKHAERHRYHLSGRGFAMLARRDRLAVPAGLRRWDPSGWDKDASFAWWNLRGSRTRQLARDIAHTSAIHAFLAAMARQARHLGDELAYADPPHRSVRRFLSNGVYHSINPDAYGQHLAGAATHHFFLEWERRAAHPAHLRTKLAPYLQYYSTGRPMENYGANPLLLVVLKDEIVESQFLRIAQGESDKAGVTTLRDLASHASIVEMQVPLEKVWMESAGGPRIMPW